MPEKPIEPSSLPNSYDPERQFVEKFERAMTAEERKCFALTENLDEDLAEEDLDDEEKAS
jgi:hypothetical protein